MSTDSLSGPDAGTATPRRPLRRDAEANRKHLLEAADEVFAESGFDVTMDEIATRAGVGVGTAYRHFGNKEGILAALFAARIATMLDVVKRALEQEDPWQGIVEFLEGTIRAQSRDRGLRELALRSPRGQQYAAEARRFLLPMTQELVDRAHAAGSLRPGIEVTDLLIIQLMLSTVLGDFSDAEAPLWRRFLPLVVDGLRPESSTPLPGEPLSSDQLNAVMAGGARRGR
jgi:AcrR family transcriptional regulator